MSDSAWFWFFMGFTIGVWVGFEWATIRLRRTDEEENDDDS